MNSPTDVRDFLFGKFQDLEDDYLWPDHDDGMVYVDRDDDTVWRISIKRAAIVEVEE